MANVRTETWVGWLGAVAVAVLAGCFVLLTFAYGEFETKEHAKEKALAGEKRDDQIMESLKSIDGKVDRVLMREYQRRGR